MPCRRASRKPIICRVDFLSGGVRSVREIVRENVLL